MGSVVEGGCISKQMDGYLASLSAKLFHNKTLSLGESRRESFPVPSQLKVVFKLNMALHPHETVTEI